MKHSQIIALAALLILQINVANAQRRDSWASTEKTTFTPEIHHPNIESVTLFAQNPEIVTPVGIAVAPDGRVFVQENHTHKRNSNYRGPESDRILVFEDTDGDGTADKRSVFYEGHTFSTDLLFGPDGHLYVSTRWFIGRFPNAATKSKADGEPEKLVVCETDGDYPHNGVGGLAIDPAHPNSLAFGFGENLGVDYTFVGTDGTRISGGGEGGSTYLCRTDGSGLTRQSTGHWNAFGMAYDLHGNLFSTDNDPNATPPNRLLHIIPGADFGYEYRYGRSGRHPLICWYGENPGTLGMIGALGEAACGLVPFGPNHLLSASWTDNRVDLHTLTPKGKSFSASREPFLSGPNDFRPVHFAFSEDGKHLYITDWVKISYPVHGHGRIWRVTLKQPVKLTPETRPETVETMNVEIAFKRLGDSDPYVRTQAIHHLQGHPQQLAKYDWKSRSDATARAHFAVAAKRSNPKGMSNLIPELLVDSNANVRFVGIKWIADGSLAHYESNLRELLNRPDLQQRELRAVVAAINRIEGESKKEFVPDDTMADIALDETKPKSLRAIALESVNPGHRRLTVAALSRLTRDEDNAIQRESVRSLALHPDSKKFAQLQRIATDDAYADQTRADAIAGLAGATDPPLQVLRSLSNSGNKIVATEAKRTIDSMQPLPGKVSDKPPVEDLDSWEKRLNQADGKANPTIGRRLFFHSKLGGCYKCHAMNGRGAKVGPDLTTIRNQSGIDNRWLLKHIVNPNAEMAPYYRPQQILTVDGKVQVGLIVGQEGQSQAYVATDGSTFRVDKDDVEQRRELPTSIMPNGLLDPMSFEEIRDLLAYLMKGSG